MSTFIMMMVVFLAPGIFGGPCFLQYWYLYNGWRIDYWDAAGLYVPVGFYRA